eukprot:GHVL01001378.1.p1 GENE.GHVL01001378.1~~GHVL01001378.1.p1  ORF type:complete len:181 (-),score=10.76 GHVL01001378.1:1315-1857(-)
MPIAWYRDESDENLFELHMTDPPQILTPEEVFEKTLVRLTRVENCDDEEVQAKVREDGNFMAHDWLEISKEVLQDKYEEKLEKYYSEHLHTDPEIRLIVAGSGYFEVRNASDKWIRLRVTKGTLINLPGGLYHRLTLDSNHYIKMLRLFSEIPAWEALNRPEGDTHPVREEHLAALPSDE